MGYFEKLSDLLRPLGIYGLSSGAGAAELYALGSALDEAASVSAETARECTAGTAESFGLSSYERLFPLVPAYADTNTRRAAVTALLTLNDASFTLSGINAALSGCGISAVAEESSTPLTVTVSFPGVRGIPVGFERMQEIIESIIPCHLVTEYAFVYVRWSGIESEGLKWSDIGAMKWEELERL